MNPIFVELLQAFAAADVRYLVVGAYALALHGRPRATGDLDLWVEPTPENAGRVMAALRAFGAPTGQVTEQVFAAPGFVFQIGLPPLRVDILTDLSGLEFQEAWSERLSGSLGPCEVQFLGKKSFIRNKRASGRPKDLVDAESIEKL